MRVGFRQVKGLREEHARVIADTRDRVGRFTTVAHFHQVTALPCHVLERLAEADAFGSIGLSRRQALWQVMELGDDPQPLFGAHAAEQSPVPTLLPIMPEGQEVRTDYSTTGLSLKRHPVALVRDKLSQMKILTTAAMRELPAGRWVRVAGLVLIRQRPATASGIVFQTLEDETGIANLIVRPNIYDLYRAAARHAALVRADGYVERQGQVVHVMVKRLYDLSHLVAGYDLLCRDFH
jgi:error-prone DNA polymerase